MKDNYYKYKNYKQKYLKLKAGYSSKISRRHSYADISKRDIVRIEYIFYEGGKQLDEYYNENYPDLPIIVNSNQSFSNFVNKIKTICGSNIVLSYNTGGGFRDKRLLNNYPSTLLKYICQNDDCYGDDDNIIVVNVNLLNN